MNENAQTRAVSKALARRSAKASDKSPDKSHASKRGRAPKVEPAARKQAILDAALTVFAERGFEAARLDDVATRAGVAKGTLYLYFKDKEALFEELLRGAVSPILEGVTALSEAPDMPFAQVARYALRVLRARGARHRPQAFAAPRPHRGTALSTHRRSALPQRGVAHAAADPEDRGARCRPAASLRTTRWRAFRNLSPSRSSPPSSGMRCLPRLRPWTSRDFCARTATCSSPNRKGDPHEPQQSIGWRCSPRHPGCDRVLLLLPRRRSRRASTKAGSRPTSSS